MPSECNHSRGIQRVCHYFKQVMTISPLADAKKETDKCLDSRPTKGADEEGDKKECGTDKDRNGLVKELCMAPKVRPESTKKLTGCDNNVQKREE